MENLICFAQQSKSYTPEICTVVQMPYILHSSQNPIQFLNNSAYSIFCTSVKYYTFFQVHLIGISEVVKDTTYGLIIASVMLSTAKK